MVRSRTFWLCAWGIVLLGSSALSSSAAGVASFDFEPPAYTTGAIAGQNGWVAQGNGSDDASAAVVQTAIAKGTQALKINSAPLLEDAFFYQPGLNYDATNKIVNLSFDINIQPRASAADPTDRSSFVVGLFTPDGNVLTFAGVADDGSIYYNNAGGGGSFTLANPITETSGWNNISLTADFATGGVSIALNGSVLPIADALVDTSNGSTIGDIDIVALPSGYDQAVFDNVSVSASNVPEPGSIALLGLGVAGLLARRRGR